MRSKERRTISASRAASRSGAEFARTCTAGVSGRCANTQASARPPNRTRAIATCLERGQTGLSVAFDLPTQLGYDSDAPQARGEVGKVGVAIDSIADMETLLDGVPLDRVTVSMTINAPAAILLALLLAVARRRGVPFERLGGTVQNDVLKEYVARGTYIYPPTPSMRLVTDVMSYCAREVPQWNTISVSGYHIREAGSTAVEEIAFTLSNGKAYLRAAARGRHRTRGGRAAYLVLLERAQRLLRRDREVSRRALSLGKDRARRFRLPRFALADASLSHADRRLDAHRAGAREQRRARDAAGARRGAGRYAVAAHQRQGRGARPADGAERESGAAYAADHRVRIRGSGRRRPDGRIVLSRNAYQRFDRSRGGHHRRGRRDGRRHRRDRERLDAGAYRGLVLCRAAGHRTRRAGRRGRQQVCRGVGRGADSAAAGRSERPEREQVAALASTARRRATRKPSSGVCATCAPRPRAARTSCPSSSTPSTTARRSARSATCCEKSSEPIAPSEVVA